MTTVLRVEPDGSKDAGVCDCCGHSSRRVWGYIYAEDRCLAAYFVHWTIGHVPDRGAVFDLIIGDWGEPAPSEGRAALSLEYRLTETGPAFMVIDASVRDISRSSLVGHALGREKVLGTDKAQEAFAFVDVILVQDSRLTELIAA